MESATSSSAVMLWWTGLCVVAFINLCLLFFSLHILRKKLPAMRTALANIRKKQFFFASLYTLGCGFRSILPRGDIRRIVLVDSWISSVVIGRTVATIAELSFVTQWSLILYEAGKYTGNKTIQLLAKLPVPIIIVAELFSWYACTTTNYIGTAIEESLWAVAAALAVYACYLARPYYEKAQQSFLTTGIVLGVGYIFYMILVDVPAYVTNWLAAEAAGKTYLSVGAGFKEICTTWHLTHLYTDWQYEMIWMSLYFSLAVWMSIYIVNAPRLDEGLVQH